MYERIYTSPSQSWSLSPGAITITIFLYILNVLAYETPFHNIPLSFEPALKTN